MRSRRDYRTAACILFLICCAPLRAQVKEHSSALLRDVLDDRGTPGATERDTDAGEARPLQKDDQEDRRFRSRVTQTPLYDWWHHPGVSVSLGANGGGIDLAEAVRDRINVRVGAEFLRYTGEFTRENALVDLDFRLGGGHAGVDVFPFQHSSFHVSPQVRFGIMTRGIGAVTIPPGQVVSFNGKDYTSTTDDPLRGTAYLSTRKIAPGISFGWGNLVPRTRSQHWTFPVDVGFYYIGQANLQITFTGTACSTAPHQRPDCDNVDGDAEFQRNLKKVIEHQRHNLSYASLFPILSFGVGYRF